MPFLFIVIVAIFALFAAVAHFTSDKYKLRKALRETRRSSVGQLAEGTMAKVVGTVRARDGRTLLAPLSGRPCVFYEVIVEEHVSTGKSGYWKQRIRDVDQVDFDLVDESGAVHVRTQDMQQIASVDNETSSGFLRDATPALEAYLQAHGHSSAGFLFNKSMRYREGIFAIGERVAVSGRVAMEEDPRGQVTDGSYRGTPKTPCLEAPPGGHLLASDESESTGGA